jgi:NAD(P)-dependent dehydrogenase (short-subunit alcohol dehydrogenase family)
MAIRCYSDAVAVVTGGGSGIGAALGKALATDGAVVVLADRDGAAAAGVAAAIGAAGGRAESAALDVRDAAAVQALVDDVMRRHGRIDYWFNNAGLGVGGEVREHTLDDWRYIVDVNLMGVIHGIHAVYPRMIEQGFGHIINTASIAGLGPAPSTTSYSATKHAVVGLSRSLRAEAQLYGVRVSALCPGAIRTPILIGGGKFGRLTKPVARETQMQLWERLRPMDPDVFARKVLGHVARNESIIIEPSWWRVVYWLGRMSPPLMDWFAARSYGQLKRQLESAPTDK